MIKLIIIIRYYILCIRGSSKRVFARVCFRLSAAQPRRFRRLRRGQQQQRAHVHRHRAQGSAPTTPVSPPRSDYVRNNHIISFSNIFLYNIVLYLKIYTVIYYYIISVYNQGPIFIYYIIWLQNNFFHYYTLYYVYLDILLLRITRFNLRKDFHIKSCRIFIPRGSSFVFIIHTSFYNITLLCVYIHIHIWLNFHSYCLVFVFFF